MQAVVFAVLAAGLSMAVPTEAADNGPAFSHFLLSRVELDHGRGVAGSTSTTYQETSASITYRGSWSQAGYRAYLDRRALWSIQRGASASLRFTGTAVINTIPTSAALRG